ncbi:type IV toxin-antitoxin system AbiEi family antitoxin domain-containing protein [Nocardia sp. NPDC058480]|uniref:type IV toxin-antitoxin system AbiEi family antitoxin domain-containing protein n=1 Tax=unclassified Nocardia TaxID=2637762 RepID=UPI003659B626
MRADSRAAEVVALAAEQNGVVTSRQAHAVAGATSHQLKRMADSGQLERLHHGIYRVAHFQSDLHQPQRVAWLAIDPGLPAWERLDQDVPGGVLSHATAARMHDLGDMDADTVELTAPRRIRLSLPDVIVHRGELTRDDWEIVDGVPVTTVARTIGDLAAVTVDAGHLGSVVRDAVAGDRISAAQAADALAPHAFSYGHQPFDGAGFRDALIDEAGIPASALALARIASQSELVQQRDKVLDQLLEANDGRSSIIDVLETIGRATDPHVRRLTRLLAADSSSNDDPAGAGKRRALLESIVADMQSVAEIERFGDQLAAIAAAADRLDPERRSPRVTEAVSLAAEHVQRERR